MPDNPIINELGSDPKFLALSPEAKMAVLKKRDPQFATMSPDAQMFAVNKHFHVDKLKEMPAQDPLATLRAKLEKEHPIAYEAGTLVGKVADPALRIGGMLVGGRLGGRLGSAAGAGITSAVLGDNPLDVAAQTAIGGAYPGAGKTAIRSAAKAATYGAVSATVDQAARTGEAPDRWTLGLNTVVGGLLGYYDFKLSNPLKEMFPEKIAEQAAPLLEKGTPPVGAHPEDVEDINRLRMTLRGKSGRFLSNEEIRSQRASASKPTVRVRLGETAADYEYRAKPAKIKEMIQQDVFPPYEPATPVPTGKEIKKFTRGGAEVEHPLRLLDHIQEQTGIPTYDDVGMPLRAAMGNREKTIAEVQRISKKYLSKGAEYPEPVKAYIRDITNAAMGQQHNTILTHITQGIREKIPFGNRYMSEEDASRIARNIMALPYMDLLPGRGGPVLRVFSHTFQTGYMKLGRYVVPGMVKAATPEGIRAGFRAGVLGTHEFYVPEEILNPGQGMLGKLYEKAQRVGFLGMKYARTWSRNIMFNGARSMGEGALKKSGWKDWGTFMDRAGLDIGVPQGEVRLAKFLYDGKRETELLDHVGKVHADFYIPGHSYLERPLMTQRSDLHRMTTQLGSWPMFYGSTLKENFINGGWEKPILKKKAIMATRWVGANAVMFDLYRRAYIALGEEHKDAWKEAIGATFLGPVMFAGGPALREIPEFAKGLGQMFSGGAETVFVDAESGQKHVWQGAKRAFKATPLPFGHAGKALGKDIYDFFGGKD